MDKAFEEILERLEELIEKSYSSAAEGNPNARIKNRAYHKVKQIVCEVLQDYKEDMKYNLAEMYAKNMVDYGVYVTEAWQTAMQQSCALEKAYIRGRQYEVDRFNELRKEYNNGWIPCSERLPKYGEVVMCSCTNSGITISCITHKGVKPSKSVRFGQHSVIAWQPLPQPYTMGE